MTSSDQPEDPSAGIPPEKNLSVENLNSSGASNLDEPKAVEPETEEKAEKAVKPETDPKAAEPKAQSDKNGEPALVEPEAGKNPGNGDGNDEEEAEPVWSPEPDKLLCALLFASNEYLGVRALKEILGDDFDAGRIRKLVKSLNQTLGQQNMPFEIVEVDATFRVRTQTKYFPWVRKLFKEANPRRLSQASLETLAIIAYKQPITKAEIEAIRGVNVDGCMKSLLEKKLVDVNGRGVKAEALGSAFTYSTTREFMRYFGIHRVPDDLPRLSEFEAIVNAQALIPQVASDGTLLEMTQPEPDGEQLRFGGIDAL